MGEGGRQLDETPEMHLVSIMQDTGFGHSRPWGLFSSVPTLVLCLQSKQECLGWSLELELSIIINRKFDHHGAKTIRITTRPIKQQL